MLAANACVFVIVAHRCIPVTWMIQSSHYTFIVSWLDGSRLGSEDRVLDTCQLSCTYSKQSSTYNETLKSAFEQLIADTNTLRMLHWRQRVLHHVFHV
jgi:hypothetical protein